MNAVFITGNLAQDPEVRATPSGKEFAKFTVAVSERYKAADGEWKEKTEWVRCTSWSNIRFIGQLTKGTKVMVQGSIASNTWENKEGKKQTEVFVNVQTIEAPRPAGGGARHEEQEEGGEEGQGYGGGYAGRGQGGGGYQGQGRAPGGKGGNAYSKPAPKAAPQQRRATPPPQEDYDNDPQGGPGSHGEDDY